MPVPKIIWTWISHDSLELLSLTLSFNSYLSLMNINTKLWKSVSFPSLSFWLIADESLLWIFYLFYIFIIILLTPLDKILSVHIRSAMKRCDTKTLPIQVARSGTKCITMSLTTLSVTARRSLTREGASNQQDWKNIGEEYSGKAVKYPPMALLVHFCSASKMFFPHPDGALRMEIKGGIDRWENTVAPGRDLGLTKT